ncbi:MAG: phenylalanine--tRNA ligase subunit beta [Desulfovibrio sp.]|nr:phenylalanine--tRNA ligase subunit beta [Desulfovibrio sp.]
MLLPLSWLREFTPYEGSAEALGDKLTMLGLELEELTHPFAHLAAITTGHVVECTMHPDSDHLHCCKVDVGGEALLDIVCGAPNVAAGQKVCVATVGTVLPDGTKIKKSKLRGQPSHGMICSERELGLSDDHTGIMVLPEETKAGQRLIDVLDVDSDVLDLSITPNRADCLSVLGLARETAMAFHLPFAVPELPLSAKGEGCEVPITIDDGDGCFLYAGRVITGLTVAPSPAKIRYRLKACNVRPISNIVDVTNYILMECGQPLHAFDYDALQGGEIHVRRAHENEPFVTLDGQERILTSRDLCICDARRPVALAGVMGGLESEITATTKRVFLESAVFHPGSIRKTSRRLGLSSESSFRFERGIDQQRTIWALDRACSMIASLGGGVASSTLNASEAKPFVPAKILYDPSSADELLGVGLGKDFALKVLKGIGCPVEDTEPVWKVTQPSWRPDITRSADLVEEIGRVHGLDNIAPVLPPMEFSLDRSGRPESEFSFWLRVRHWGAGLGLNECINYSFVGQKDLDALNLPAENRIAIMNPLSSDQNVLRTTIAPGLLQSLRNNLAQGAQSIRLFELAHVFSKDESSETGAVETGMLGILLHGLRNEDIWPFTAADFEYSDLRGLVEHLASFLHLGTVRFVPEEDHPYLVPAVRLELGNASIGCMGRVRPEIADIYLAQKPVWLCEIDLEEVKRLAESVRVHFTPLPSFPPVRRDITVIGDASLTVGAVIDAIRAQKNPLIEDIAFVSLYEPEGKTDKHLSFRLTFRHAKKTLKDSEVDKERTNVANKLQSVLGVRI